MLLSLGVSGMSHRHRPQAYLGQELQLQSLGQSTPCRVGVSTSNRRPPRPTPLTGQNGNSLQWGFGFERGLIKLSGGFGLGALVKPKTYLFDSLLFNMWSRMKACRGSNNADPPQTYLYAAVTKPAKKRAAHVWPHVKVVLIKQRQWQGARIDHG